MQESPEMCEIKTVEEVVAVQRLIFLERAPRSTDGVSTGPHTRSKDRESCSPTV